MTEREKLYRCFLASLAIVTSAFLFIGLVKLLIQIHLYLGLYILAVGSIAICIRIIMWAEKLPPSEQS